MPYPTVETHADLLETLAGPGCCCSCGAHGCASLGSHPEQTPFPAAEVAPRYPVVEWHAGRQA